jgi:hypothetical protein
MELFGQFIVISATIFSLWNTHHNKPNRKRNHLPSSVKNYKIKLCGPWTSWHWMLVLWLISILTNNFFPVTVTILVIRTHTWLSVITFWNVQLCTFFVWDCLVLCNHPCCHSIIFIQIITFLQNFTCLLIFYQTMNCLVLRNTKAKCKI